MAKFTALIGTVTGKIGGLVVGANRTVRMFTKAANRTPSAVKTIFSQLAGAWPTGEMAAKQLIMKSPGVSNGVMMLTRGTYQIYNLPGLDIYAGGRSVGRSVRQEEVAWLEPMVGALRAYRGTQRRLAELHGKVRMVLAQWLNILVNGRDATLDDLDALGRNQAVLRILGVKKLPSSNALGDWSRRHVQARQATAARAKGRPGC